MSVQESPPSGGECGATRTRPSNGFFIQVKKEEVYG